MVNKDEYQYLIDDAREYLGTRWELAKLTFLEKLARIIGLILFGLVVILLTFAIIGFGGIAAIFALSACMPTWAATLIIVAVWALLLCGAVTFRKQLFINPVLAAVSAILFAPREKKKAIEN